MASTDYGTQCTIAGVTGKVINVDPPALSVGVIETTNHSSAGWREYIADTLMGAGKFTLTMEVDASLVGNLQTVFAAFAAVAIVFTETGMPAWTFNGILSDFQFDAANASKPTEATVKVTIQPTGALTFAAAGTYWDTDVEYLFLDCGGLLALTIPATHQLVVYKVIPGIPPVALNSTEIAACTFASSVGAKASVSAAGLIASLVAGDTTVKVNITAKAAVETAVVVTVT